MNSGQTGEAIQIITPKNHKFEINLERVRQIFEADDIKDRHVVVVSIAGPSRKGKSFLMNFLLNYLYAQYKKHDASDWIGERDNYVELKRFRYRGGRNPETTGIYMWSELFTHDFENGEKVAIVLLDTQGIFDNRTGMREVVAIFAVSMMLASVQCYNVMQDIQEDDIQHLELFTEFGRIVLQQSDEKPFQTMLFIVRDWQNSSEIPYGDGKQYIDEQLTESGNQTEDMHQLRRQIKSSFDKIGAYLMPYPGPEVANGREINGDLRKIDSEFVTHIKKLVPLLLAPQNLIGKKINGQKIRCRDFVTYMQSYVNVFNSNTLPAPQSVLDATAATLLVILCGDCFNHYSYLMQKNFDEKLLDENDPYFSELELKMAHDNAVKECLLQFREKRKLGGTELIRKFETELTQTIEKKFPFFVQENERRSSDFKAKSTADLRALHMTCLSFYDDSIQKSLSSTEALSVTDLQQNHQNAVRETMAKFDNEKKLGDDELISKFRDKLESDINVHHIRFEHQNENNRKLIEDMKHKLEEEKEKALQKMEREAAEQRLAEKDGDIKNIQLQDECFEQYKRDMRKSISEYASFIAQTDLNTIHEAAKENAISKFQRDRDERGKDFSIKSRLESLIDGSFIQFSYENDTKRKEKQAADKRAEMAARMAQMQREIRDNQNFSRSRPCSIL